MKLSNRLIMSINMITPCPTIADIGCDHAFSSIYLIHHKIAKKAIAMDLRTGPLEKANSNILLYNCQNQIETRLSNGIAKLEKHEADVILICGMGGKLMIDILKAKKPLTDYCKELVLQPQSDVGDVRRFLYSIGFIITEEDMCIEDNKYYISLKAKPETNQLSLNAPALTDVEYEFGKLLLDKKHPVLKDYVREQLTKANLVLENLTKANTVNARKRLPGYQKEYDIIVKAAKLLEIE